MATKTVRRPQKTAEERAAEVDVLTEQLNTAVTELTTSDAWLSMLKVSARFTKYSPSNVLLLWMQAEQRGVSLTRVAGYRTWQTMGRQVIKGSKSFAVMAPIRRRLTVEEAQNMTARGFRGCWEEDGRPVVMVRGFKLERVFRLEDTEGEPLPDVPEVGYVTGETPEGAWDALVGMITADGFKLTEEPEDGETRGHTDYTRRIVNVDPGYPLTERVHIALHEIGHVRCDHEGRDISRGQRETEAESVAFVVCSVLGLDLGDVATIYTAGWNNGDAEVIQAAQTAIHKAAQTILADLAQIGEPGH